VQVIVICQSNTVPANRKAFRVLPSDQRSAPRRLSLQFQAIQPFDRSPVCNRAQFRQPVPISMAVMRFYDFFFLAYTRKSKLADHSACERFLLAMLLFHH
jgi:hypothetical protein